MIFSAAIAGIALHGVQSHSKSCRPYRAFLAKRLCRHPSYAPSAPFSGSAPYLIQTTNCSFFGGPIFVPLFRFPSSSWCCRSSQSPSLLRLHRCTRKFRCPPGVRALQSPIIRPLCYDFPKAIVVTHLDCALAANSYIPFFHPHNVRFADLFALIVSQNAAEHKNRNRGLNCGSCSWSYGYSAGIEWFRTSPDRSVCGQAASRPCSTRKFRATSFTSRPSTSTW